MEAKPPGSVDARFLAALFGIALCGSAMQLEASRFGIGVSPYTVKYIRYAWTILGTEPPPPPGITRDFLVHFPPMFPLLLAGTGFVFKNIYAGCRLVQAILFFANIYLSGMIAWWLTERSSLVGILSAAAFLIFRPILTIHLWGWSEPLFMFAVLCTLWALARAAETMSSSYALAAGSMAAIAALTRYAGVALVPCGLALLFIGPGADGVSARRAPTLRKFQRALLFGVLAVTPLILLLWHNRAISGKATNRQIGLYQVLPIRLREGASSVFGWFFPLAKTGEPEVILGGLVAVCAFAVVLVIACRRLSAHESAPPHCSNGATWNNEKRFGSLGAFFSPYAIARC